MRVHKRQGRVQDASRHLRLHAQALVASGKKYPTPLHLTPRHPTLRQPNPTKANPINPNPSRARPTSVCHKQIDYHPQYYLLYNNLARRAQAPNLGAPPRQTATPPPRLATSRHTTRHDTTRQTLNPPHYASKTSSLFHHRGNLRPGAGLRLPIGRRLHPTS